MAEYEGYSLDDARPKPLNVRERKFVKAVCEGKDQTEAVYLAGYKPEMTRENAKKLGSQIAHRPHVAWEIDKRMGELGISTEWVEGKILKVGNDPEATNMEVLKAAELGGKRLKMFDQPAVVTNDNRELHVHVDVSRWSEQQLLEFLATKTLPGKEQGENSSQAPE